MNVKNNLTKEEIDKLFSEIEKTEKINKKASISFDGTNFVVRIPKEVADYLKLTPENKNKFKMVFDIEEKEGTKNQNIQIMEEEDEKTKQNK